VNFGGGEKNDQKERKSDDESFAFSFAQLFRRQARIRFFSQSFPLRAINW
jgi:hypothetical protein